jgi:hypothetical protein
VAEAEEIGTAETVSAMAMAAALVVVVAVVTMAARGSRGWARLDRW